MFLASSSPQQMYSHYHSLISKIIQKVIRSSVKLVKASWMLTIITSYISHCNHSEIDKIYKKVRVALE